MPPSPRICRISYRRPSTVPGRKRVWLCKSDGLLIPALPANVPSAMVGASEVSSKRVGDDSEGKLSDAGDEPTSEGDFTPAVPSALAAGSLSGRRTWRLSMALSPQAQMRGRKRATVAAPGQE